MQSTTVIRSRLAIGLGALCALGTAWVLFWHVHSWADITSNHVMTGLSLVVTLGAGHLLWQAVDQRQWGSAFSLFVLFLAGTLVCVTLSAGRGHEVLHAKVDAADFENAKRLAHEARLAEANTDRKAARISADKALGEAKQSALSASSECESGVGSICREKRVREAAAKAEAERREKLAQHADSHYWVLVGELTHFKPAQQANIDLKRAAEVVAFLFEKDVDSTLKGIELLWPFALALITEFGTIAFFHFGFGHRKVEVAETVSGIVREPAPARATVLESAPAPQLAPELAAVVDALEAARGSMTNKQLARTLKVAKGTASKRVSDLEAADLVTRERDEANGREVKISLKLRRRDDTVRVH